MITINSFERLITVLTFDQSLRSYRFSQIFEPPFQVKDLLVLVGQQYQQVVLLLLGLLHCRLQLCVLRLQDGDRAGGRGQLLLQLRPALRRALGFSLSRQNAKSSETITTEQDKHQIQVVPQTLSRSISVSCVASRLSSSAILAASIEPSFSGLDD